MVNYKSKQLRELMRILERKLGLLDENQISCCNITLSQCHVIVEIGRSENTTLNKLSKIIGLDNSTICRSVDNLVKIGLVERGENMSDRRFINIQLTKEGKKIFSEIENRMNNFYKKILQSIPEDKQDQVLDCLNLLNQVFEANKCC